MPTDQMRPLNNILRIASFSFVIYHIIGAYYIGQEAVAHYTTHVFGAIAISALSIFFLGERYRKKNFATAAAIVGSILAIVAAGYLRWNIDYLQIEAPFLAPLDVAFGFALVFGCLIVTGFVWGGTLPIVVIIGLFYLLFGPLLPFPYGHPGNDLAYNAALLGMGQTSGALKWVPLSSDTLFLIMVFGGVIHRLGVYKMFMELGKAIGNYVRGGVAVPAVIGSAMIGTVTGVSIANVMITGASTIPAMIRSGFPAKTAAAIESVASSGAQILPPIMGLGIFILAEFVGQPYIEVAWKGLVPALVYFITVGVAVLLITRKNRIPHETESVNWRRVAYLGPQLLVPLFVLVYMLSQRYSGLYAGSVAVMLGVFLYIVTPILWREKVIWKRRFEDVFDALAQGGIVGAQTAVLILLAGMLAEIITITNIPALAGMLIGPVFEHFPAIALIITAAFTILLGTGLPTVIAYVLGAITMAPILQQLGYNQIGVHFFIFYFAVFANITPPIALNVMVASRIAGCSVGGAIIESVRLSIPAFLLPFLFLYQPSLLAFPEVSWEMLWVTVVVMSSTLAFLFAFLGVYLSVLSALMRLAFLVVASIGMWGLIVNDTRVIASHVVTMGALVAMNIFFRKSSPGRGSDLA